MRKIFILLTMITSLFLFGCSDDKTPGEVLPEIPVTEQALASIDLSLNVSEDFDLVMNVGDVDIAYTSSNVTLIRISGSKAIVSRQDVDSVVKITATAIYEDLRAIKEFDITVKAKDVIPNDSYTLDQFFELSVGSDVLLEGLTCVAVITSQGSYFTDSNKVLFVSYVYGNEGSVYNVSGTKTIVDYQARVTDGVLEQVEGEAVSVLPIEKTLEELCDTTKLNDSDSFGYFRVTGKVVMVQQEVGGLHYQYYYLESGDFRIGFSSLNKEYINSHIGKHEGEVITLNVYLHAYKFPAGYSVFYTEGSSGITK